MALCILNHLSAPPNRNGFITEGVALGYYVVPFQGY